MEGKKRFYNSMQQLIPIVGKVEINEKCKSKLKQTKND